ncbi:MAG: phosphopantetheine-protein transferase [Anaerolineae bacterium]|nr:MAG: phosphopantetheine-protein transferase [Anaerolineae bacterium]WKZ44449.1 MAG: 4'-phosphopantetheinyl transferase superfamily protein [Anaerolineales bacterium]
MTEWLTPSEIFELSSRQVDVWRIHLVSIPPDESALSAEERQRAAKFHFDKDRHRYIVSHTSLRGILARYLHRAPEELSFSVNEYGKPFLTDHELEFNLSHSGDYALIAVTRERKVGVDVERIRAEVEIEELARRNFSPREVSELTALPLEERLNGFFSCWTRKEAYIKAQGLGLSLPLDSFDVSLGEPALLRATRPNAGEAAQWTMLPLDVDSGYAGALAVRGNNLDFRFWDRE